MKLFAVALMFFTAVVLIVSLTYILSLNRTKEKLALLEKGMNPNEFMQDRFWHNSIKAGMFLFGIGIGFVMAVLLDEYVLVTIDNPGLYAGCVLLFGGLSLILFYRLFKNNLK